MGSIKDGNDMDLTEAEDIKKRWQEYTELYKKWDALISHTSKVMLKILQARLQQYVNRKLPDVQAGLRNGKEPEIKLPTSAGSSKKQESSRKTSISANWLCQSLWLCGSQ